MSKIKERTKELTLREASIKKKLLGQSEGKKSKAKRVGQTALIGGVITLGLYAVYRSFIQEGKKAKKQKVNNTTSSIITEKLVAFLLPYLAQVIEGFINRKRSSKTEETQESEKGKN